MRGKTGMVMKKLTLTTIAVIFIVCLGSIVFASTTADVTYDVPDIASISLGDPAGHLDMSAPAAGTGTFPEVNTSMDVNISANNPPSAPKKVTISTPNVTASSKQHIDDGEVSFMTDIYQDAGTAVATMYLTGNMLASVVSDATATITFTLTNQ